MFCLVTKILWNENFPRQCRPYQEEVMWHGVLFAHTFVTHKYECCQYSLSIPHKNKGKLVDFIMVSEYCLALL